jgi:hypothetical protein
MTLDEQAERPTLATHVVREEEEEEELGGEDEGRQKP